MQSECRTQYNVKGERMKEDRYKKHKAICFYAAVFIVITVASFYIITRLMMPFVIAWIVALMFRPLIDRCVRRTGIPRKIISTVMLMIVLSLVLYSAAALIDRGYGELKRLAEYLANNSESIVSTFTGFGKKIMNKFHVGSDIDVDYINSMAKRVLENSVASLSAKLTSWVASFFVKLPEIIFVTVIFIMASFYISADVDKVNKYISSLFPERLARRLGSFKNKILNTAARYLRAYLILLCITFVELLISFLILKIDYALLLAAIIALLDILPAIGVGTVLLPWAAILLFRGNIKLAIALIVVYVIITVIRQVAESYIIGTQLGISALATLFAVYVGFRIAGILGMVVAPLAALLIKNAISLYLNAKKLSKGEDMPDSG